MTRLDTWSLRTMAALLALAVTGHGFAGDEKKHGDDDASAYEARKEGNILGLTDILAKLGLPAGSEVVEVEFERKNGVPVYEIYFVDQRGRRREIEVDARTGRLLGKESD